MITMEQIRAARALLDWNQADLAKAAAISKPALANLERGTAQPRMETLNAITRALEDGGIEFTDGPGVRLRGEVLKVEVFEGKNAVFRLWEDQFETLKKTGGMRLFFGVDERTIDHLAGKKAFRDMMEKFHQHNITSRILIRDGDTYFVEPITHYRWISDALFEQTPYCVYGNKYAINLMRTKTPKIVLIENEDIATCYRNQFEAAWVSAKIPTSSPNHLQ